MADKRSASGKKQAQHPHRQAASRSESKQPATPFPHAAKSKQKNMVLPEHVVYSRWNNKNFPKAPLVEVLWYDAMGVTGDDWAEPQEIYDAVPAPSLTVGYLWVDHPSYVTVIALVNESHVSYGITIPRGMVKEIRHLG